MREPGAAKAGRLAVTITAATFLVCMIWPRVLMPSRSSMVWMRLLGERRVLQAVAGAVEADHQAIADQHIVADALDLDQVLDPGEGRRPGAAARAAPTSEGGKTNIIRCAAHERLLPCCSAAALASFVPAGRQKLCLNNFNGLNSVRQATAPGNSCPARLCRRPVLAAASAIAWSDCRPPVARPTLPHHAGAEPMVKPAGATATKPAMTKDSK